jgi:hypothetical protein
MTGGRVVETFKAKTYAVDSKAVEVHPVQLLTIWFAYETCVLALAYKEACCLKVE